MPVYAQQHNFLVYSLEEGLPQSQVFALLSDSEGYMWFGTQGGGLSRFDGADFVPFNSREGLSGNYVYTLFEDNAHQIWAGTSRGATAIKGNQLQSLNFPEPIGRVSAFAQPNDSTLWIGTDQGIWAYIPRKGKPEKLKLDPALDAAFITDFLVGKDDIWICTDQGVFRLGDSITHIQFGDESPRAVQAMTRDSSGNLWIAAFGLGLEQWDENTGKQVQRWTDSRLEQATSVYVSRDQRVWVGTQNNGVWIYQVSDDSWAQLTEREGLPNNNVRRITEDRWGNIWIATSGGGVCKYLGQFFLHYDRANGLPDERVYALDMDSSGTVWASVGNSGLARLDSLGFTRFQGDSSYLSMKSKALHFDKKGRMWVGTEGGGLLVFDTSGYQVLRTQDGLPSDWIRSIREDANGRIWVATYGTGIAQIIDQDSLGFAIRKYGREAGLNDLRIMDLAFDAAGRLWFCTRFGETGYLEGGRVRQLFGKESGLPEVQLRSIAFDALDQIWIGTAGEGLFSKSLNVDSLNFVSFADNARLSSTNLYLAIFDQQGHLWVGNERGVDKIIFNEAGVVTEVQTFGRNEGFLGIETCLNTAICDPTGNLWFGTLNGLTRHLPTERVDHAAAPFIHFQEVSLFYKPLEETAFAEWSDGNGSMLPGLELPYKQNHLRFSFRGVDLNDPAGVSYHWRLEGAENDWSPFSDQTSVNYTNLLPGTYLFQVQAISGAGMLSEPISASFTIKKPFWQLRWVQLVAAGTLLGLFILLFRLRIRSIKRREARKRAQLEMENNLLQLEQKALQLQMNPHFIFNALNSIQSLVATQDYQTARREITNFAGLMRAILSNSRKQLISLEEEVETLERYLKMEQFCQTTPFEFTISLPNGLDPTEVEIPPMLIQPFVENAVIHGLSHLQHPGRLGIRFSANANILECEVIDNGVGRERAEQLRKSKSPGHQSVAMQVTKERLEALLAKTNVQALEISDILDGNGQICGTKVIVRLPLSRNF